MTIYSKGILFSTFMFGAVLVMIFLSKSSPVSPQKAKNIVPDIALKSSQTNAPKQVALQVQKNTVEEDDDDITINISLKQGETLSAALSSANIAKKQIVAVSDSLKEVINLRKLMPGQKMELSVQEDGEQAVQS